jgi:nitrate/TMAO reductase-like tetraheme cytochrome c subunit
VRRAVAFVALAVAACSDPEAQQTTLSREELLSPETCKGCHSRHYQEWSGSMHAYAAQDPVFSAMNRRGQEETGGVLGTFCVNCHAPMAVREGATSDGLNLDQLDASLRGITCYFCHNTVEVQGTHNAPLRLAGDTTLRGGIHDAKRNDAHGSKYSRLHDRERLESSDLCGSCHDIVLPSPPAPAAVHLERTFAEWKATVFNRPPSQGGLTCGGCHMTGREDVAADVAGVPLRRVHAHTWPGVDRAITQFPERDAQAAMVARELDQTLRFEICVRQLPGAASLHVTLENVAAGHHFPSGAAQDRRVWVEVSAHAGEALLYQSGNVPAGEPVAAQNDPSLWLLRDRALGVDGKAAHMFWQIAELEPNTLPGAVSFDPTDPDYFATHVSHRYPAGTDVIIGSPDRVTLRVHVEPIAREVLDDLVQSGHLSAADRDAVTRLELLPNRGQATTALEWTPNAAVAPPLGFKKTIDAVPASCVTSSAVKAN